MNLFNYQESPLAYKYRPKNLNDFYGQGKIVKIIFKMLENKKFISSIFYGPSGIGKTTLAKIIANELGYDYHYLNAIKASKSDIKELAEKSKKSMNKTLLFFDEIHRFNKLQQDSLLEDLENGNIILIGATTENPYYSLNRALISRTLLFEFKKLTVFDITNILKNILKKENFFVSEEIIEYIANISDGDARFAINILETIKNAKMDNLDVKQLSEILNFKVFADKYDAISAMIKSIRGSDPDASIYWLAKLLVGGEDPLYIARRLVILASEDIGLANINAMNIANSCLNSVKEIGMPEARIILSNCVIYLALSPKSNSSYLAINLAINEIEKNGAQDVPIHLTKVGKEKYKYPHDYDNSYVKQKYMNKFLKFYEYGNNKFEQSMKDIWSKIKNK